MPGGASPALRVLMLPSAIGLSHLTRLLTIAIRLRTDGVQVAFGYPKPHALLDGADFPRIPVADADTTDFSGNVFASYSEDLVEQAVKDELNAIKDFRPDVVVGDFRLTAAISARLAGVPYVPVVNAYMTDAFDPVDLLMPEGDGRALASFIGGRLYQRQKRAAAAPFRKAARAHRIRDLTSLYDFLTGQRTLIADLAQFCPLKNPPASFFYIGPLIWEGLAASRPGHAGSTAGQEATQTGTGGIPEASEPDFLRHRPPDRRLLYVTVGNTGDEALLHFAVDTFAGHPSYDVLMTTGAFIDPGSIRSAPNITVRRFVPGSVVMRQAEAVIHTGGNGTTYQAMAAGVPALVVPFNNDQRINAWLVLRNGVGKPLSPAGLTGKQVYATLRDLREDSAMHSRLAQMKVWIAETDAAGAAAEHIQAVGS
jgi:UDP:flavonoid glycosyltransferase YjiC (YdhE family)